MSVTPSKQAAITAYRHLLKTQRKVFIGDHKAIEAAKKETHARFSQHRHETNVDVLDQKLKLAEQIANFLEKNSVEAIRQGKESVPRLHVKGREGNIKFRDVTGHIATQ